ncbi:MAG: hypothetical protein J5I90_14250 [Caldilineales bacterium]|nr:hypothetical protein [Caldilineales bacterium]
MNTVIYGRGRFDSYAKAQGLLELICRHEPFVPDRYGRHEPIRSPFSPGQMEGAVAALLNEERRRQYPDDPSGMVLLKRTSRPKALYIPEWSGMRTAPFGVSLYEVENQFVYDINMFERWIQFSFSLFAMHDAWFAYMAIDVEKAVKTRFDWIVPNNAPQGWTPGTKAVGFFGSKLEKGIPGIFWGNYFNPFYVDWLGREKFDTLPCVDKRDLSTGGIYFTTAPTPWDWDKPEYRSLQRQVMEHLGADAFFDMETLRERVQRELGKGGTYEPEQLLYKCRVPEFPFDRESFRSAIKSLQKRRVETIENQEGLGLKLVEEPEEGVLVFERDDGERVRIDIKRGTVDHWSILQVD